MIRCGHGRVRQQGLAPCGATRSTRPKPQALLRREDLAQQRHAAHELRAEAADGALRAGPAGNDAEAGFGRAELHVFLGNAEIGGGGEFEPAAQRVAVQRGDERLAQRASASKARWPWRTQARPKSVGLSADQASMSPPAQKDFSPSPVMMAARMPRSASIRCAARSSASTMS